MAAPQRRRPRTPSCPNQRSSDCCAPRQSRRAEFLRPCRVFGKCSSPLDYVGAILKTFVEMLSQSRMMRGLHPNRTRGRKARREGGGNQDNPRDEQLIRSVFEHDEQLDRARLNTTNTLHPQEGGSTTFPCQRTVAHLKHGGGKPAWGSPQNACILWGPRVGGGILTHPRDEKPIRGVLEYDEAPIRR